METQRSRQRNYERFRERLPKHEYMETGNLYLVMVQFGLIFTI
eukprot:UN24063